MKIGVIGSGSWGSALAVLLSGNGHEVVMWSAFDNEINRMKQDRENKLKLPGVKFQDNISFTTSKTEVAYDKDLLVIAVPSKFVRSTMKAFQPMVHHQLIVNVAKGIEDKTHATMEQVIHSEIGDHPVVVLSGPSHAEEVSRGIPTSVVAASTDDSSILRVQEAFMNEMFRVYGSNDILGVELGGALKNVIALAAGISDGLGFGDNSKAALMTRGMAEISRLGKAMGAEDETFSGLSGMGDLIVTCTSMHSRNRRAGILIGQGASLDEALNEVQMVVEGVYSARAAYDLAQEYQVEMPIISEIYHVLFRSKSPREAVLHLMERDKKYENG